MFLTNGDFVTNIGGTTYLDTATGHVLLPLGGTMYIDTATGGVIYEEASNLSHDIQKLAAAKQKLQLRSSAEKIQATYGLSAERSLEVARLSVQLAGTAKNSMTDADYDSFSKALTGSTMKQFRTALRASREGNTASLNELVNKAAETNGVGPEHMNQIMQELFK